MKSIIKNTITKKVLIVFIIIIMLSNFIVPNVVLAKSEGEKLVSGLFYLIAYVGDAGLSIMQRMMMGTGDLKENGEYAIRYSPGLIFAGEVPMLDIDFINADENSNKTISRSISDVNSKQDMLKLTSNLTNDNFTLLKELKKEDLTKDEHQADFLSYGLQVNAQAHELYTISAVEFDLTIRNYGNFWAMKDINPILSEGYSLKLEEVMLYLYNGKLYKIENYNILGGFTIKIFECDLNTVAGIKENINLESTAYKLKGTIAKWYMALRTIALVGLLSVLVYIGIRIILSSGSANNKAKYKNMLQDWVVAICILFVLHYMMAFMLNISSRLNDIIRNNVIQKTTEGNNVDVLFTEVRKEIGENLDDASVGNTAGYTIMYLMLVVLTGVFTAQYFKRVVYMAFLTMIAPMIALTYPLDKIKDNKAQAFSFWLREYIFNCILQTVHLLLYTVLISSAFDFAKQNILYAIVAMGFMVPAEKLIKDMFGMKSSTPVGTLGAAAGGAVVMSMLNKLKSKPPKQGADGAGGADNPKGVRTATRSAPNVSNPTGTNNNAQVNSANAGDATGVGARTATAAARQAGGGSSTSTSIGTNSGSAWNGIKAVGKRYISGPSVLKSGVSRFTGALAGVAAGTVGLSAGLATGDFGKTIQYGATGFAVGSQGMSNLSGRAMQGINEIYETYNKGEMGVEAYNNQKFDKAFYKSDGYKQIVQDSKLLAAYGGKDGVKAATQQFLENGITDPEQMRKAMKNNISGDEFKAYSKLGISAPEEMAAARKWGSPKTYADLKKIAKFAKGKTKTEFIESVKDIRINGNALGAGQAETVYNNIVDLL